MRTTMRVIGLFAALSAVCVFSFSQDARLAMNSEREGVFVHISHGSDDPHRLLMGLQMAATMAADKKDVIVYCDITSVRVLTTTAADVSLEPFPTLHELLARLTNLKVPVMACPTCMKVAGIEASELRQAVSVARKNLFFSFTGGRILSIDY